MMMTDRRRKGSIQFYHNSKRGLSTLVPSGKQKELVGYYLKVGMDQSVFNINNNSYLLPYTLLRKIQLKKKEDNKFTVCLSELKVKRARKKNVERIINADSEEDIHNRLESAEFLDVIGLTKGKGTTGAIQRRNVKKGKRKGARANCTRRFGSKGLRGRAKMDPRRPFAGKDGHSIRTILNCRNLGTERLSEVVHKKHYSKEGEFLLVKGSVPGKNNTIVKVRPSLRKS